MQVKKREITVIIKGKDGQKQRKVIHPSAHLEQPALKTVPAVQSAPRKGGGTRNTRFQSFERKGQVITFR